MQLLQKTMMFFLATIIVGCLPEVEAPDPSTIVEWENFMPSDGLAGSQVNAITEDSNGNLWIATNNGVSKFDGISFTSYRVQHGLLNNYVTSVIEFEPGLMVFGTLEGLSIFQNGAFIDSDTDLGGKVAPPYEVWTMGVDRYGNGWLGTSYGLYATSDGINYVEYWDQACYECNYINDIFLDSQNYLWFCTNGDLERFDGQQWRRYKTSNGLPNNYAQTIFEDDRGVLWVGTQNGLARQDGDRFVEVDLYNSADQNWVYTIGQDSKHKLWFGPIGNGLIYFDGAVMRSNEGSLNDLRKSTISSYQSSDGTLWFGTNEGGLWRYRPKQ